MSMGSKLTQRLLGGATIAGVAFTAACGAGPGPTGGGSAVWGSASTGSDSFVMMEAMVSVANKQGSGGHSTVATAGSVENTALVDAGELQFGSSTSDTLYAAANGDEPYDEPFEAMQVMAFVFWTVPIVAPADSGIRTLEDLRGKSVAIGNAGQSSAPILKAVMSEAGVEGDVDLQYLDGQDSADALASGQIDAASVSHLTGDHVTPAYDELSQTLDYQPITVDQDVLERVVESNPSLTIESTSADTQDSYTDDVNSPATTGIVVAGADVSEETVYETVKSVLENIDEVKQVAPTQFGALEPEYACENLVDFQPVHPGAERYFAEKNLCGR